MGVLGEFKRGVDVAHGDWFGVREGTHLLGVHPLHPNDGGRQVDHIPKNTKIIIIIIKKIIKTPSSFHNSQQSNGVQLSIIIFRFLHIPTIEILADLSVQPSDHPTI
ncbi:hypothetical protein Hanom_Chr12g01088951 [Helianthus anomalus]